MFFGTASPRRSIPINTNLQGARRWQTREPLHPNGAQEQMWRRGPDGCGAERAKAQMLVSSVGEDRAVLLGFTMMGFSVLMFFVVGITTVKPYVNSNWEEASCVLAQVEALEEWVDCRGVSTVPCLRVTVNLSGSERSARLHHNEESVLLALECFYVPKCQMDKTELQEESLKVKEKLQQEVGSSATCLADPARHPEDAILNRKYTLRRALLASLWPGLMLGGGALLVALVKLNQYLSRLCLELSCGAAEDRATSAYSQGKLYKLIRRSSSHSPSQDCAT